MAYTKDQRIINQNPGKTPYELLQLGLSQEAYDKLQDGQPQPKQELPERITPPVKPVVRQNAQPKLSGRPAPNPIDNTPMATLVNKKTGKRTRMTRSAAMLAMRMDKANYRVI